MMHLKRYISTALTAATLCLLPGASVLALETTGTPGSPSATTTISGKQLPAPEPEIRRRDQG